MNQNTNNKTNNNQKNDICKDEIRTDTNEYEPGTLFDHKKLTPTEKLFKKFVENYIKTGKYEVV